MAGEIQALFNKYQQKYPLYTKDAIVDLMLDDGVITFDTANKIKQGVSLFLLDNDLFKPDKNNDFNITEIMGGNFNTTKTNPKTHFNRRIEPTKQPKTQGDCWLLSDINALSYKDWGRKAIHDAIVPDEDGSGGVTIKFKGSPLKQKEIHITAFQIDEARKSGNYADGDDDMIAFELATEQTFRQMVRQGLAERVSDDKSMQNYSKESSAKYRSYIWAGVKTDKFNQYPISELLGIHTYDVDCMSVNDYPSAEKDKDRMLKWFSQNKDNVAVNCGFSLVFNGYGDENSKDYIHGGHAYAIKDIVYGKEVILTDPHYSDYEIKMPYDKFKELVGHIIFSFKNSQVEKQFKNSGLPQDYEKKNKRSKENYRIAVEKMQKEEQARQDSIQAEWHRRDEENKKELMEIEKNRTQRKNIEIQKAVQKIKNAKSTNDFKSLTSDYATLNSKTIMAVLEQYPDIVILFDKEASGWGNGNYKCQLIQPIIQALSDKARDVGINQEIISEFEKKCYNETNAIFYTDEKIIQSEVEKMVKLIKSKS